MSAVLDLSAPLQASTYRKRPSGFTQPVDVITHRFRTALISGGVAGCVAKTATAPLTRLVVLAQTSSLSKPATLPLNHHVFTHGRIADSIRNLWNQGGIRALWRGNLLTIIHRFPFTGTNFAVEEAVNARLPKSIRQSPGGSFLPGAIAGSVAVTVCYPLEVMRTRVMIQAESAPTTMPRTGGFGLSSTAACVQEPVGFTILHRLPGFFGIYRGLGTALGVTVPAVSISFAVYRLARTYLEAAGIPKDSMATICVAGGGSGMAASGVTFPLDVLRRRLQVMDVESSGIRPCSCRQEALNIFRAEGICGFWRGFTPEMIKVVPTVAITFLTFERLRIWC